MKKVIYESKDGKKIKSVSVENGNVVVEFEKKDNRPRKFNNCKDFRGFYITVLGHVDRSISEDIDYQNIPTEEQAESLAEAIQVIRLHHEWTNGWKPTGEDAVICISAKGLCIYRSYYQYWHKLYFKTEEEAKDFLETFKDKIKKASYWI